MPDGILYVYPLPNLNRYKAPDEALPSDAQYLRNNPEAIARIRSWVDPTRPSGEAILLAFRVRDERMPETPDGWHLGYHLAHPQLLGSREHRAWKTEPNFRTANALAFFLIECGALVDPRPMPRRVWLFAPTEALEYLSPGAKRRFCSARKVSHA